MRRLILLVMSVATLFAVDIPITQHYELQLAIGKPSILDFPFKILGANTTPFVSKYKPTKKKDKKLSEASTFLPPPEKLGLPGGNKKENEKLLKEWKRKKSPVVIKKGASEITILPKKFGTFSLIIWGYKKYPIMLDITVLESAPYRYFHFVDYSQKKKDAERIEANEHEKVITILTRHLFNNRTPKGYTVRTGTQHYHDERIDFKEIKELVGKRYKASLWILTNKTQHTYNFYEPMFYKDGVYSVAIENRVLGPGEKTRVFIVSANTE